MQTVHNHFTRDIKPRGECPSCDEGHDLDDLRNVVTTLRNLCQNTESAKKAINLISEKTGLPKERVKEILVKLSKQS